MRKRLMAAAAAVFLLAAALPLSVRADDHTAGKDLTVTFTGDKLESSLNYNELALLAQDMQPGDRMIMEVTVKNAGGVRADWYLSNEVLQTFEETGGTTAGGGAYTYVLTYTDSTGTRDLYNSNRVGGEKNNAADSAAGLRETEEDYNMYLGRLGSGESGLLRLTVTLDGETQGNDYAQTLASLRLNFAAEQVVSTGGSWEDGEAAELSGETVKRYVTKNVKTGDYSRTLLWTGTAVVSGLALLFLGMAELRRNRGGKKDEE